MEVRNSDVRTVLQKCEWCNTTSHLSVCTVPVIGIGDTGLLRSSFTRLHLLGLRGHAGLAVIVSTWKRAWLLMCLFSPEKEHEFKDKPRSSKPHTKTSIFSFSSPYVSPCSCILISQKRKFIFPNTEMLFFLLQRCVQWKQHMLSITFGATRATILLWESCTRYNEVFSRDLEATKYIKCHK